MNQARDYFSTLIMLRQQVAPGKSALHEMEQSDPRRIPLVPDRDVNPVFLLDIKSDQSRADRAPQEQPSCPGRGRDSLAGEWLIHGAVQRATKFGAHSGS